MNTQKPHIETTVYTNNDTKSIDIELRVDGGLIFGRAVQHKRDVQGLITPITVSLMTAGVPDALVWETAKQTVTRAIYKLETLDTILRAKQLADRIQRAINGTHPVTVYGPYSSGNTYNACKLAVFFRCHQVLDEPTHEDLSTLTCKRKTLVLNHTPVDGTINIAIKDALQAAGLSGPSKYFGPTNSLEEFMPNITEDQATPEGHFTKEEAELTKEERDKQLPDFILSQAAWFECMHSKGKLTSHKVNGCNDPIEITVMDEPGDGGANHLYLIEGPDPSKNKSWKGRKFKSTAILFQNCPVPQNGTNGVTQESLLAILIDHLEGFQGGKFACIENQVALNHLRSAQETLKLRTKIRVARGVEGTNKL